MKRLIGITAIAVWLACSPLSARAGCEHYADAYDDSESHPLRLVAYAVYPFGVAIEWLLMRPIHYVVSQPRLAPVFGHVPHEAPVGEYYPCATDPGES